MARLGTKQHDYAFVTFQDENSVERALNDRWILEKYQNVQRRIPKRRRDWRVDVPRTPQDYQVYLEGIPPETSQRDIEDWVHQLGRINPLECVILHDQRFVRLKYASADEAEYAARGMDRKLYIGCALKAYVNQQVLDNIAPQRPGPRQHPERRPR